MGTSQHECHTSIKEINDAWAIITILYIFARTRTGISRKHGETKQFDCVDCGIMQDSFSSFLPVISVSLTVIHYFFLKIYYLRRVSVEHKLIKNNQ